MERRVAFIGTHNWRVHEAVRSWSAAYGHADRAVARAAAAAGKAPSLQLDVFGVGREPLEDRRSMVWQGLRPGADVRVASRQDVNAVVCSGYGPNDVKIVKDCRRAGKAVFVESLERFQPGDIAELAAGSPAGTAGPALMTGLYLRFDSVLQEAAQLGIEAVVGRPLLYQAHASTITPTLAGDGSMGLEAVTPSLYELGMEQVDVLRFLLKTEATEVYAAGSLAPGQQEGATQEGLRAYKAVSMTIKTSSGVVAVVSLDVRGGSSPRQHISVVGDTNRASFSGEVSAADPQAAGINHFLDVAAEGAPARLVAADCLAAAAIMAAAQQSLRTGSPVAVCYDWSAAAASAPEATETESGTESGTPAGAAVTVRLAASSAGAKLGSAACSLMEGAKNLLQGTGSYMEHMQKGADVADGGSGASTPVNRGSRDEEEEVSTPPHNHLQGTPTLKAIGTPESPPLVSAHPN